jgi:hypothetical protein
MLNAAVMVSPNAAKRQAANNKLDAGLLAFFREPPLYTPQERLFMLLDQPASSFAARLICVFLFGLIMLSTMIVILASEPTLRDVPDTCDWRKPTVSDCEPRPQKIFCVLEITCVLIFTFEYVARVATVHSLKKERIPCSGISTKLVLKHRVNPNPGPKSPGATEVVLVIDRAKLTLLYVMRGVNLVDLLAIVPFWLACAAEGKFASCAVQSAKSLAILRVLRLARIVRVFKFGRYCPVLQIMVHSVWESGAALVGLAFYSVLTVTVFGSLVYFAEGTTFTVGEDAVMLGANSTGVYTRQYWNHNCDASVHPQGCLEITPFTSMPKAFWYALVTMTTVGYGDYVPTSTEGKMIGAITMYVGIIMIALPISVLGGDFNARYAERVTQVKAASGGHAVPSFLSPTGALELSPTHTPTASSAFDESPPPPEDPGTSLDLDSIDEIEMEEKKAEDNDDDDNENDENGGDGEGGDMPYGDLKAAMKKQAKKISALTRKVDSVQRQLEVQNQQLAQVLRLLIPADAMSEDEYDGMDIGRPTDELI